MTENTPERQALLKVAAIHHSWELYEAVCQMVELPATHTASEFWNVRNRVIEIMRQIQKDATP